MTGILGGRMAGLTITSPAVEAKNTFSYIVMQVIWCLKFCNVTNSGGTCPPTPRDLRPCSLSRSSSENLDGHCAVISGNAIQTLTK